MKIARKTHNTIGITVLCPTVYLPEGHRPEYAEVSFSLDNDLYYVAIITSSFAERFEIWTENFKPFNILFHRSDGKAYFVTGAREIGIVEIVEAARTIAENRTGVKLSLNTFEIEGLPSDKEINSFFRKWTTLDT